LLQRDRCDYVAAVYWLQKTADQGCVDSSSEFSKMHKGGVGISKNFTLP
jgi:TPR repeat protein